ncbi:MAG: hypothetical protein ABI835_09080 [Chloroflexota bacterium]
MQKYRASNRVPFLSFILLVLVGLISAIGVGLLLWAVETYLNIYLIIAFPIIAGAIVGGALLLVVKAGKVRSPVIAGLIGLLAGALMYGVYHFAGYYITFRSEARTAYIENSGRTPTDAQLDDDLNDILQDEVGATGFLGYLQLSAREGFSITRGVGSSSSSSGVDLSGTGVWIFWGVELLIAAGLGAAIPARAAGEPFDEEANTWYGKPTLIGTGNAKARKAVGQALENGDFQGAGVLLTAQNIKYPRTEVTVRRSPIASGLPQDAYLTVSYAQRKGRNSAQSSGIVSPTELEWLTRSMQGVSRPVARTSAGDSPSERFEF